VLSAEGLRDFAREGAFLPLAEPLAREQLKKIE